MNLYVDTIASFIQKQLSNPGNADAPLVFMVPEISGADAVALMAACKNLAIAAGRPAVVVASRECMASSTWTDEERRAFEWEAGGNSLTYFRNKPEGRPLAVLLGTADAGDSGSLDDFFQCDSKTVFDRAMEKKFNGWVLTFLQEGGVLVPQSKERIRDWEAARGKAWNDILGNLRDATSLADVSRLLASALAAEPQSSDEDDWFCAVLRRLPGLPNLSGFVEYAKRPKKHRTFRHYADLARDFANYHGSFLDENAKKKRLDAIAAFRAADPRPEVEPAPFATVDELLDALDAYIRDHETGRLDDLKKADFVMVADRILGAKPVREPSEREPKDSVKKLTGSPVETLLMGAWLALGKFWKAFAAEDGTPATPESIEFKGILYKFRREGVVDAADALEDAKMVLGGLDGLVTEHLRDFEPVAGSPVGIVSDLLPADLQTKNAGQSDPSFVFHVTVRGEGHETRSKFALLLPDIHAYRLAGELVLRAKEVMDRASADPGKRLPVFHLPYYRELLLSRDEEETAYVLDAALKADAGYDSFATFLFTDEWRRVSSATPLAHDIDEVDRRFREFLDDAVANGLHAAVGRPDIPFVKAYLQALGDYTDNEPAAAGANKAAAMLLRAFLFVDEQSADHAWRTADFEPSALVTVLHPGLLEMLQAQWVFLFDAFFSAAAEAYRSDAENPFREGRWTYYEDLAGLKYPLTGLPIRKGGAFELTANGTGLLFRIGSLPATDATASTRFLTKIDNGEDDEEIAAGTLFRETSESRLFRDRLEDYRRMHPESADGLSVAVYRNEDVQPILSGVDAFLRSIEPRSPDSGPFVFRLVVFSESSDTSVVTRWLSAWQDYIESDDGEDAPYPGCQIAVSHRLVAPGNGGCVAFARVIRDEVDVDVFVLYNFIRPDGNGCRFEQVNEPYDRTRDSIKFPILEQAQVACGDPDDLYHRSQIVSNRQFAISDAHANLSRRLAGGIGQGVHSVVLSDGDFSPWRCVVDAAHEAAEWVVAIDPLVDRTLIGKPADDITGPSRELIGFGTGVGQHGESNFTVSTQQTDLQGLASHLKDAMRREVFRYGTPEADERIAQHLLREARELSGLSIVRAIGPGQYVRDFLAYALLRRMLPTAGTEHLCNRIFSIDAYRHWFDIGSEENRTHPDLLWLVADIDDATGSFRLSARLVECKMAESVGMDALLDHAFDQIQNGLKVLSRIFAPRAATGDLSPDARYWHLQLHRLIANGVSDVPSDRKVAFLQAMERLADGDFSIDWDAAIYTFITDNIADASLRRLDRAVDFSVDGLSFHVQAYQCGYPFIDALCSEDSQISRAWNAEIDANGVPVPAYEPRADFVDADAPEEIVADEVPEEDAAGDLSVAVADPIAQPSEAADDPAPRTQQDQVVATNADGSADAQPAPEAAVLGMVASMHSVTPAPSATAAVTTAPIVASSPGIGSIPDRILLGKTDSGREVYWEFGHSKLANRHLLIFGSSGQGKTYAIQTLLCELGRKKQHSLILDYTEGFKTGQLEPETVNSLCPEQHIVRNAPLPIDPFAAYSQNDNGIVIQDRPVNIAKRVAAIFKSVYPDTGPIQHSILVEAIKTGLGGQPGLTLEGLKNILDGMAEGRGSNRASIAGLSQRIGNLADENPFEAAGSSVGWEDLFTDPTHLCHVFQLTGLDRISRRLIVEFVLWDLYAHVRANGRKDKPKVLVLDEVQNLSQDADAPLSNYLAEARKFGISLIMATQSVSNAGSQEFKDKLFLASEILLFKPPAGSAGEYAKIICDQVGGNLGKDEWKRRLMNLSQGECYAIGPVLDPRTNQLRPSSVERIKITSLPDRGF